MFLPWSGLDAGEWELHGRERAAGRSEIAGGLQGSTLSLQEGERRGANRELAGRDVLIRLETKQKEAT
jgi:hypothetical protein